MKNYAKFLEAGIRQITPRGWLYDFLYAQKTGLTGHIEVAGYPFDRVSWGKDENEKVGDKPGWWAYEQTGYHLDGKERLSLLLRDRKMHGETSAVFDYVLKNADPDGYLGPKNLKSSDGWNRWPHVVFFRALLAEYDATRDRSILEAIEKHYLAGAQRHDRARDVFNTEIMLRVYLAGGDKRLLDMAKEDFASYNAVCRDDNCARAQLSRKKAYAHGVTYNEYSKLGALFYICTGDKSYLKPSVNAYKKIDRYQMLPDGLHCSNEFLLDNDYMQTHETCDISDFTWAQYYMLEATGKAEYADKIERCIFNAGVGAVSEDFRALQYFSCANQLVLDRHSNHSDFLMGDKWLSYRPNPGTECCAGNVNRFMPNFCAHLFMTRGRGVAAVLYAPSEFSFGRGESKVTVREETLYPFEDRVVFSMSMKKRRRFKFYLRMPGWCAQPTVTYNGEKCDCSVKDGFAVLDKEFGDKDEIVLDLPAQIRMKRLPGNLAYVERGPLLFSLGMKGNREIDKDEKNQAPGFPAYNTTPDRPFNYALVENQVPALSRAEIGGNPFSVEGAPLSIKVLARRVPEWKIKERRVVHPVKNLYTRPWKRETEKGLYRFTPRCPTEKEMKTAELGDPETITLIPYGASKVRVTVFPLCKEDKK